MPQGICRDLDSIEPDRALTPGACVCVCVCVCVWWTEGGGRLLRGRGDLPWLEGPLRVFLFFPLLLSPSPWYWFGDGVG